jgi:ankyrin repeat protein
MVKLFIAAGADTAIRYFHNRTCLHVLSDLPDWTQKSYQPVSEENPNFAAKMYTNPHDYPGVFKALVDAKADISARVHNGDTPLCTAANRKNAEAVRALLAVGADPNYINDDDESALLIASRSGCLDAVTALIAARADVNCASRDSPTALYYACALRRVDIISALISAGADVNCISVNSTPLDLAIIHNNNAIIAILKDAGAVTWETLTLLTNPLFGEVHTAGTGTGADTDRRDPNRDFDPRLIPSVSDRDREDALRFAVATSNLPIAKHLLAAGVSPHIQLCSKSLLCAASVRGCTDIVRELLDAGADITVKDDDDMTALQWAAKGKHRDIVALLLAKAKELKNANKREDRRTE